MTLEHYIDALNVSQRQQYDRVAKTVEDLVQNYTVSMSYKMPTFWAHKRVLLHFGAFSDHCSLFPASDDMIAELGDDVAVLRAGKGTLRFVDASDLPDELLRRIISYRLDQVAK